jgi:CRP-like cAMP-binding protein
VLVDSLPQKPIKNRLLAALIHPEYEHLLPYLERVELTLGEVVYVAADRIDYVYFPETAVISLLATLQDGATTEVGLVGREGMVGLTIFLGGAITAEQALVQLSGSAMRMKAKVLTEHIKVGTPLHLLLLRYTRSFLGLMTQSVVCSQHHSIVQRFARWILMMHDYSDSNILELTHEMVAAMIGTRRAGVTTATQTLRDAGVIANHRGVITILDRARLEKAACECYAIIRNESDLPAD